MQHVIVRNPNIQAVEVCIMIFLLYLRIGRPFLAYMCSLVEVLDILQIMQYSLPNKAMSDGSETSEQRGIYRIPT